ncbi:unnamed protein product [Zymoseptoria tritici ST99CH_1A5]|uniref:Uncharacterized protein n=1 Tax=Zymoseptoria tritici ST99CH_1A5 TaxID=1276529 RepID=A0A1Y6M3A8_ZYMTR|nr:unnamed protein product [Zymoseptoria tritici ST99CH_1A5]
MAQLRLCVQREKTGLLEDTAADLENPEITFGKQDGHRTQRSRSQRYLHLLKQNVNDLKDFGLIIMLEKQNVIELKVVGLNITFGPSRGSALNGAERCRSQHQTFEEQNVFNRERRRSQPAPMSSSSEDVTMSVSTSSSSRKGKVIEFKGGGLNITLGKQNVINRARKCRSQH